MARNSSDLDRVIENLSALTHRVTDLAREGAVATGTAVRSAADGVGTMAAEKSEDAMTALRGGIRAHPLLSIAGAIGVGISVARLLRR